MYVCALYVRTYVYTYVQSIHTNIRSYEWTAHTYIHTYVCAHIVHTLYIRTYVCKVHTYIRIYFHMHGQYICTYVWTVVCVGRFVRDPVFTEGRHLLLNGPSVYESAPFAFDMYRMYVCMYPEKSYSSSLQSSLSTSVYCSRVPTMLLLWYCLVSCLHWRSRKGANSLIYFGSKRCVWGGECVLVGG